MKDKLDHRFPLSPEKTVFIDKAYQYLRGLGITPDSEALREVVEPLFVYSVMHALTSVGYKTTLIHCNDEGKYPAVAVKLEEVSGGVRVCTLPSTSSDRALEYSLRLWGNWYPDQSPIMQQLKPYNGGLSPWNNSYSGGSLVDSINDVVEHLYGIREVVKEYPRCHRCTYGYYCVKDAGTSAHKPALHQCLAYPQDEEV